jgi:hypothetical protein
MFKDYKYLRMAIQNEDRTDSDVPYFLVNTDRYFVPDTTLEQFFHPTSQDGRGNDEDAIKDFTGRLDHTKTVWRTIAKGSDPNALKAHQRRAGIYLNTTTTSSMVNTGIEELTVGDVIYAMPAVAYLAKNNPSVNTYTYRGKMYLHPMLISVEDHTRLLRDLIMVKYASEDAKTTTVIGGMIKNMVNKHGEQSVDLTKIVAYMSLMRPVGVVEYSLDAHRQSIYNITTTKVAVGSEFICTNNQFH